MSYKTISIWNDVDKPTPCPQLDRNIDIDVLIIGGGITGISTAYHLKDSKLRVCLVEKNEIGGGVTSRTTGKLTYLQERQLSKINMYHGKVKTKMYLESQIYAMTLVKDIIKKEMISCNLEQVKSYTFSHKKNQKLQKEYELLKEAGINLKKDNKLPNGEKVYSSFYIDDTYVFHPIKYLYALKDIISKSNISIYEHTKVLSVNKHDGYFICRTDKYNIKAKYVVFATHYPYFTLPFLMPLKASIEKSYLEAFKVDKNYLFSAISISKPTISTRFHSTEKDIYQLYLTNSHNYCIFNNEKKNFKKLINSKKITPDYVWSNKDIITNDALPFIGAINNDKTLLIGTGYNTWGMTNGSLAGKVLADIVLHRKNRYIKLFNPKRGFNIGKLINLPISIGSSAYAMLKTKLSKNKSWYSSKVRFKTRNGKNIAIYTDEDNIEHIVYNLCPHLKCSLIFNEIEKTWDCPCHGSRFDIDGNSIEGPSNYNITYKE